MSENPVKGNQGKRYSAADKAEMAKFIADYNEQHKRGGMKAASEKYGVSVVTLSNWGKASKTPKKKRAKAKKVVQKKVVKVSAPVEKVVAGPGAILSRMQVIISEVGALEKEYEGLKKKL